MKVQLEREVFANGDIYYRVRVDAIVQWSFFTTPENEAKQKMAAKKLYNSILEQGSASQKSVLLESEI